MKIFLRWRRKSKFLFAVFFVFCLGAAARAQDISTATVVSSTMSSTVFAAVSTPIKISTNALPEFVAELKNPNDYQLFANGGWDGGWTVGYDRCWVQKISVPKNKGYQRAFIGAKLGRAKAETASPRSPSAANPIDGEIYIAIQST